MFTPSRLGEKPKRTIGGESMTLDRDRINQIPSLVHHLMMSGAWLVGSAADPNRNYERNPPRDWDLCIEPKDWFDCSLLLVSAETSNHSLTRFGGQRMEVTDRKRSKPYQLDCWVSTLAETMARMTSGPNYAFHLKSGVWVCFGK
jgi:hypothetical protein